MAGELLEHEAAALEEQNGTLEIVESNTDDRVWRRVLHAAAALPGVKVNRESFLRSQLKSLDDEQIELVISSSPAAAGVDPGFIDDRANSLIKGHVARSSSISFATGIPGGFAMLGTIPADLAQYFWHLTVIAQQLAYLYGWPNLLHGGEIDEETEGRFTILIGAMMGAASAQQGLKQLSRRVAQQVATRGSQRAVGQQATQVLTKRVGRWIGVKITKDTFSRGIAKAIPLLGGIIGAGLTVSTMWPMSRRLKSELSQLPYARPGGDDSTPELDAEAE